MRHMIYHHDTNTYFNNINEDNPPTTSILNARDNTHTTQRAVARYRWSRLHSVFTSIAEARVLPEGGRAVESVFPRVSDWMLIRDTHLQ